jgi:hypothetical protein
VDKAKNLPVILPIELEFQGVKLSCPHENGHRMVPVRTVCEIIDVDFKNQDVWLKEHPFFAQLYKPSTTTGADGKQYSMNCLSIFDVDGWLHSIGPKGRKPGSIERQYAFLGWLREQKLALYKSVEEFISENKYEAELEQMRTVMQQQIADTRHLLKEQQAKLKEVDTSLTEIRSNRYNGQTVLAFPEQSEN